MTFDRRNDMNSRRTLTSLLASSLLGVIAVAAGVTGVLSVFGWWVSLEHGVGVGASAALVIGVLILAYAARDEYLARPRAIVLGIIVAAVAVLASLVALLEGRSNEAENLLYIAGGLGIVTLVVVLLSARRMTSAMEA
jgi:hypothetical protein